MENEKLGERVASVETELKSQNNRISNMEKDKELLYRLTVVSEQQQEMNKNQQKHLNKMDETLNNININLTNLNTSSYEMREDLNSLESELKDVKENNVQNNNRGKFDVVEFLSKDVPKYIGIAVLAALLAYLGLN